MSDDLRITLQDPGGWEELTVILERQVSLAERMLELSHLELCAFRPFLQTEDEA